MKNQPENKSTNEWEEWRKDFDNLKFGSTKDIEKLKYFIHQEIEKGYQRGIEKGRKIGYADCLEKHEII